MGRIEAMLRAVALRKHLGRSGSAGPAVAVMPWAMLGFGEPPFDHAQRGHRGHALDAGMYAAYDRSKGVQESENAGKHRAVSDMTRKEDAQSPAQHHRIISTT